MTCSVLPVAITLLLRNVHQHCMYDWLEEHTDLWEPEEPLPSGVQLTENTEVLKSNYGYLLEMVSYLKDLWKLNQSVST